MINKEILKDIKLVVFDLDGTLLDENGNVGEESKNLINELSQKGVLFSIATGRLLSATTDIADELNIKIPLITLDGTLIQRFPNEKSIYVSYVKPSYVKRALHLADKYLLNVALCHDNAIYYTEENSIFPNMVDKFGAKYKQVYSYENFIDKTLEVVLASDYQPNIKLVANKMRFPFTLGLSSSYYKTNREGGIYLLEIRKLGSSKGDGLKKLLKHLKIKMKNTAVIGDWYNDKSLFENDSIKIAMGNAVPELKRMADYVLKKTNNEDGVADFLKMILQAKK
ncbi:MAG: HAD family hydrolase [Melioribacteraceae bacterium]|nr:HAD family hydrolase [Melioribacteraceae bacterium]